MKLEKTKLSSLFPPPYLSKLSISIPQSKQGPRRAPHRARRPPPRAYRRGLRRLKFERGRKFRRGQSATGVRGGLRRVARC